MLLRSYFHWKSWDHSVTLTLALDFFKWYWFRKSWFGFDSLAEVRGWLNMSSSVRLFSCPDQSCWLLWPSQDVFSRLSCGFGTFFCRVNNKFGTNQSLQTLVKDFHSIFFFFLCTLHFLLLNWPLFWLLTCGSICFILWMVVIFSLLLKPQCDYNGKGKHAARCEEWLKKCSFPGFLLWTSVLIRTTCS